MGKRRERFVSSSGMVHDTKLKMLFHSFYQYLYRNTTLQSKTHLVCLKIQQCKPDSGRLWMVIIPNTRQFGIDNVEMRQVLSALHQKNKVFSMMAQLRTGSQVTVRWARGSPSLTSKIEAQLQVSQSLRELRRSMQVSSGEQSSSLPTRGNIAPDLPSWDKNELQACNPLPQTF